jgi:hypothetical protein
VFILPLQYPIFPEFLKGNGLYGPPMKSGVFVGILAKYQLFEVIFENAIPGTVIFPGAGQLAGRNPPVRKL